MTGHLTGTRKKGPLSVSEGLIASNAETEKILRQYRTSNKFENDQPIDYFFGLNEAAESRLEHPVSKLVKMKHSLPYLQNI